MRRAAIVLLLIAASCSGDASLPIAEPEADGPTSVTGIAAPSSTIGTTTSARPPVQVATTSTSTSTSTSVPIATTHRRDGWFLVSVTGWLPDGFSDGLRAAPGVSLVSEVWVGNAPVVETRSASGAVVDETRPGFALPLEVQVIDPSDHAQFVPPDVAAVLRSLAANQVLLGSSSARFRRLGVGATITLESGVALTVAGVVDDEWVGFAEFVSTTPDPISLGADRPRYAVVRYDGGVGAFRALAETLTDGGVRVGTESDVPVFRHADAVRPQIQIKERFGEFSYRPTGGDRVEIDPDWVDANIVTVDLPLIGAIRCHRDFAALLGQVMEELAAGGNGAIITPASETGCYKPRFIAGRRDLSRHAWGIAADINWGNDAEGPRSPVAPPLLEAMAAAGITSGHAWTDPDPGHFEWIGDSEG